MTAVAIAAIARRFTRRSCSLVVDDRIAAAAVAGKLSDRCIEPVPAL
jgi:hypothetical protein